MANVATAFIGQSWALQTQVILLKSLVALGICDSKLQTQLKIGDRINFPFFATTPSAVTYTPGTDVTIQHWSGTNENLIVDRVRVVPFYVDDVHQLLMDYNVRMTLAEDAAFKLRDVIDIGILAETANAGITLFDVDIGGVTGAVPITVTIDNIIRIFSTARERLRAANVPEEGDYFAVITPRFAEVLERATASRGFQIADSTLRNGFAGTFLGFHLFISNNLPAGSQLFGKKGGIHFVMKQTPIVDVKDVPLRLGNNFLIWTVWGQRVFNNYRNYLINVRTV